MASPAQQRAFSEYDFAGDARWVQYRQNLEIPVGRDMEQVLARYKAKFYQRHVDPDFVIAPSPAPAPSSTARPPPSGGAPRPAAHSAAGAQSASSPPPAAAGLPPRVGPLPIDRATLLFLLNAWVAVMGLVAFFPLMPAALARRAYKLALGGALAASLAALVLQTGLPRTWNLGGVRAWLVGCLATAPFLAALYCFVFLTSPAVLTMAVVPVAIPALLHSAAHLQRNFGQAQLYRRYLSGPCTWLEQHAAQARLLQANAEIGVGFSLLFQLLSPQRSFVQLFVYWNLLKIMYHAPPTSFNHRASWAAIQQRVQPLLQMVPAINTPLQYAQNWFQRV
ncbi:hypothetical protein KFL_006820010 [Klebsormidium nitens]|uniref:Uncharacterized protein n=1 Tax=Klebsormidium nitens TaxID=105231 RepID=A0A1Y1IJ82_KLENI|nr:hypothetical protein KFL_006820010 [Klebsormidium nitens]|eukprot:GAQ90763.1 hypothetical protein KFL_006820010 [Klebsormidium nitens]